MFIIAAVTIPIRIVIATAVVQYAPVDNTTAHNGRFHCGDPLSLKLTVLQRNYPSVTNLNEMLAPFVTLKYIVIIDNFQPVNLKLDTIPKILRRPVPLCLVANNINYSLSTVAWGPGLLTFSNVSAQQNPSSVSCTLSKFLDASGIYSDLGLQDICLRINLRDYFKYIKPWTGRLHLVLHPDRLKSDKFDYPIPFHVNARPSLYSYEFSDSTSPIQIVASVWTLSHNEYYYDQWLSEIVTPKGFHSSRSDVYLQDILLIFRVAMDTITPRLTEKTGKVSSTNVLKFCPTSPHFIAARFCFQHLSRSALSIEQVSSLKSMSLQASKNNLHWRFNFRVTDSIDPSFHMLYFLSTCGIHDLKRRCELNTYAERIGFTFAHVWHAIIQNHSFMLDGATVCANGKVSEQILPTIGNRMQFFFSQQLGIESVLYQNLTHYSPYFLPNGTANFRFISCGQRGLSKFLFAELINIFDSWTWLLAHLSIVTVSCFIWLLMGQKLKPVIRTFTSQIMTLLEQGNPYPERMVICE